MFFFCSRIQSRMPCCTYSSWLLLLGLLQSVTVSRSFLVFHDLDSFEAYWSGIIRMPLSLGYLIFFSWVDWDYRFGEESTQVILTWITTLRCCLPGFSTAVLLFFPYLTLIEASHEIQPIFKGRRI